MDAKVMKEMPEGLGHNVAYFYYPQASAGAKECVTNFTPRIVLFSIKSGSRTQTIWTTGERIESMTTTWETDRVTFFNTYAGHDLVLIAFG